MEEDMISKDLFSHIVVTSLALRKNCPLIYQKTSVECTLKIQRALSVEEIELEE